MNTALTWEVFGASLLVLFLYMSVWAIFAALRQRLDLADIAWGPGFALIAWVSFAFSPIRAANTVVNILVTCWAVRLALHLYPHVSIEQVFVLPSPFRSRL